jgi:cell division protein FtsL
MTPPATAAGRLHRSPTPRAARRISGPARPPRASARPIPLRAAAATAGVAAPFALRLGVAARRLPDARLLDRLVRGRAWIALVAVLLLGIVFMQVSMLKLNTGISRAVATEATLQRQNSALRAQISQLDSGERLQQVAAQAGMLMPPAGEVHFLGARAADAALAVANLTIPNPVKPSAPIVPATTASAASTASATATTASAATAASGTAATAATTTTSTPTNSTPAATPSSQSQATQTGTTTTPTTSSTGASATPTGGATASAGGQ